jgi:hypothetical protein
LESPFSCLGLNRPAVVDWSKTNPPHLPKVPSPRAHTAKQRPSAEVSRPQKEAEPPRRLYRFNYR